MTVFFNDFVCWSTWTNLVSTVKRFYGVTCIGLPGHGVKRIAVKWNTKSMKGDLMSKRNTCLDLTGLGFQYVTCISPSGQTNVTWWVSSELKRRLIFYFCIGDTLYQLVVLWLSPFQTLGKSRCTRRHERVSHLTGERFDAMATTNFDYVKIVECHERHVKDGTRTTM